MSTLYLQAAIAFRHVPPTGTASMAADGEDQDSIDTDQVPAVSAATL